MFCRRGRCGSNQSTIRQDEQNLISSAFGSQLCSSRVFRAKYMLDNDQGVASEIMSFRRVITNAERRPTFEKVISMYLHCKNKNFPEESEYFRLTIRFVSVITKGMGFKLYLNKIYVKWSKINNFASCLEAEFCCEMFPLFIASFLTVCSS